MKPVRGLMKALRIVLQALLLVLAHGWSLLALNFCVPGDGFRATALAAYILAAGGLAVAVRRRRRTLLWTLGTVVLVALWWNGIEPSGAGSYPPETAVAARASFDPDGTVTVRGVRNFLYRSETGFDVRREDRTFRLDDVRTVDLYYCYWGLEDIAHTMLSFGFADGRYLAVSVEIRREEDETYDTLRGIFKQYEIIYVWANERDVVLLRTNHRREKVHLYRTTLSPEDARHLLVDMLEETERLAGQPAFYNTVTRNCTSSLVGHVNHVLPRKIPWWQRRLRNGIGDRRGFEAGWIAGAGPFETLRARSEIGDRARAAGDAADFSVRIRTHL